MLYVGNGQTKFQEFRGNFRIENDINRRIGLRNYTRQIRNWTDEIVFTEDQYQVKHMFRTDANAHVYV